MEKFTKRIATGTAVLAFAATAWFSAPHIKNAYQRHKAETLIEAAYTDLSGLQAELHKAQQKTENNIFILTPEERTDLAGNLENLRAAELEIENELVPNRRHFFLGQYDKVRSHLDPEFGLENGQKRETPSDRIRVTYENAKKVIDFCEGKRTLRDTVFANELFLKARLKKPYNSAGMAELPDELALLPADMLAYVPTILQEMRDALKKGDIEPELYNSMGANILKRKQKLQHIIERAREERTKEKAKKMLSSAHDSYVQVKPRNDQLKAWYRPSMDGIFIVADYKALLGEQNTVVDLVHAGDNTLQYLDMYYDELHDQYYIYVADNSSRRTTFSHTRLVPSVDFDGNVTLKTDTYTTDGCKFYYTLRKVTSAGHSDDKIYVGERDGSCIWSYARDEQEGWVRTWKRLHYDNGSVRSGWLKDLNPQIEPEYLEAAE